ncbi:SgcJ/EcaC family oxidoreductase [Bradyrhizobium sp. Ce-3]|uniref:SgcJ/EcaC family oxidoreductase n=1 Tax=Bradyrhizobium sp. Ce-3 TaxID=2913970 RepID=UPI001FB92DDD|nr:SgcJ/EcaC family oxidoreductase [Bradyrhizobium sp. Ce-3]
MAAAPRRFADRALPDIVFTNIFGMFSIGKPPFVAQHERIFSTIYKGSTNHIQIEHIALIKPDVAIVDTLTVVAGVQQAPPGVQFIDGALHTRLEQVLVRRADGWWIASFHNVAVNPAFASGPPPKR